jgi:hypothetical protein
VKEHDKGQGSPEQKPTSQNNAYLKEQGKLSPGFPTLKPEQPPHGGVNKPELHPPKELPLHFEPNLPSHEQQPGNLDPKLEDAIRAYAMGDPEEEARLREQAKNDPILRDELLHPGGGLAYGPHPPDLKTKKD